MEKKIEGRLCPDCGGKGCENCGFSGWKDGTKAYPQDVVATEGAFVENHGELKIDKLAGTVCPDCKGKGMNPPPREPVTGSCQRCNGTGWLEGSGDFVGPPPDGPGGDTGQ